MAASITPIAYKPTGGIPGTSRYQNLLVGTTDQDYTVVGAEYGVKFWSSPNQDFQYVIAHEDPTGGHSGHTSGGLISPVYLGFWGTKNMGGKTDEAFLNLVNYLFNQNFVNPDVAYDYINTPGPHYYWTNYKPSLYMEWDLQNSSYPGTGSTIYDLTGNNLDGSLVGTIEYTTGSPNYLTIEGGIGEYLLSSMMSEFLNPPFVGISQSILLWIYPTSNGIIISETGQPTPNTGWHDAQIQRDSSGRFLFGVWPYTNFSAKITSPSTYALNNWYLVGFTYDGSQLQGYVNGTSVGVSTYLRQTPGNMYYNFGANDTTKLSNTTSTCTYRFGGVRMYNKSLTNTEVLNLWNDSKSDYGY